MTDDQFPLLAAVRLRHVPDTCPLLKGATMLVTGHPSADLVETLVWAGGSRRPSTVIYPAGIIERCSLFR